MNFHAVNAELEIASIVQENHRQSERSRRIAEAKSSLVPARIHIAPVGWVRSLPRTLLAGVSLASESHLRAGQQTGCYEPRSAGFAIKNGLVTSDYIGTGDSPLRRPQ